jgi:competence protein ComEC
MNKLSTAPGFKFAVLFIAGILIGASIKFNLLFLLICFSILVLFFIYIYRKNFNDISILFILSIIIIFFGIIKSNIDFYIIPDNSISKIKNTSLKEETILNGIIDDIPNKDSSKIRFVLNCKSFRTFDSTYNVEGLVMVTILKDTTKGITGIEPAFEAGDEVELYGRLSEPARERNPGEFDYKRYLSLHNIHKIFYVKGTYNAEIISKNNLSFIYQKILYPAKLFANNNIDSFIGGNEGAFLKGLVTGDRGDFTQEMKDYFVKAGVMHLIAVSGLNVAYIILSVTLLLSLLRIPLIPRTIITIIILILYCLFTGSPASIIRASVMGILALTAYAIQRKINFYNIAGFSALVILIYDSKQLFDAGFILSFCSVLSMVFFYERFENIFINKFENWLKDYRKYLYYLLILFFTSLSAQIGTVPISAMYFGKISIISIFVNVIAVPLSNISLAIGFFQILVATFSTYLSSVIAETNSLLLFLQLIFIKYFASFEFAYFEFYKFNILNTIFYFLVLIYIFTSSLKNLHFRISLSAAVIVMLILFNLNFDNKLRVSFMSVGQGECFLVQSPDGKNILIDCGPSNEKYDSGEKNIAPFLKRNGVSNIDILILTHKHNDHTGGADYLIRNFNVNKILTNNAGYKIYYSLLFGKSHPSVENIRCGDIIKLDGVEMFFLYPFILEKEPKPIVFKLKYNKTEILFTSDISEEDERELAESYGDFLKSNVLKVSHHGSKNSSSVEFLDKAKPECSIISCGFNNRFGHPAPITIDKLKAINSDIFRTDIDGMVILESDGNNYNIKNNF